MPLLDHFRPPISEHHRWDSFHSNWATRIADRLNDILSPDFLAEEHTHHGQLEIDSATYEQSYRSMNGEHGGIALAEPQTWAPPVASETIPFVIPDSYQVRVYSNTGGLTLVAVIELVSPANKDRPEERRAFCAKVAGFLHQGISVLIVDVVTSRNANLHHELLRAIDPKRSLEPLGDLYAGAYRPVVRNDDSELDIWTETLSIGRMLPTVPLRLTGDQFVPVHLESAYNEAPCLRRRIS